MLVTLIGKNTIQKIILPKIVRGNYWLSDKSGEKEKKLLNIEAKENKWEVLSSNYVRIINPKNINIYENGIKIVESDKTIVDKIVLKENAMNAVLLSNSNEIYIILYISV